MNSKVILIVEDTLPIGEIIELTLNDEPGYQATAVANGADALAFGAEFRVDLVLLDVNLPGLDGFAIHDLVRARPATATVPILFMTAGEHAEELTRRGVTDWLKKPFDIDDLVDRVAAALAGGDQAGRPRVGDGQ